MDKDKIKDKLMQEFDFLKAHSIMALLGWKWAIFGGESQVPSVSQIKESVSSLIDNLLRDEKCVSIRSGGFRVQRYTDDDGYGEVEVIFEAVSSCADFKNEKDN